MLTEQATPPPGEKRIGIIAHGDALRALLSGLVAQWRYTVVETPSADDLLLVEEGCLAPSESGTVVWLTSSRYEGRNRLGLPLRVDELYRNLESRYHKPPRNHIRIPVQLDATVEVRGESLPVRISSLSDLGVRFDFPRELVSGEKLVIRTMLENEQILSQGHVIYAVPKGDLEGSGRSDIGVILDQTPQETRSRIHDYILWRYLALARLQVPESLFCEGIGFLQIPDAVLKRLGCL